MSHEVELLINRTPSDRELPETRTCNVQLPRQPRYDQAKPVEPSRFASEGLYAPLQATEYLTVEVRSRMSDQSVEIIRQPDKMTLMLLLPAMAMCESVIRMCEQANHLDL